MLRGGGGVAIVAALFVAKLSSVNGQSAAAVALAALDCHDSDEWQNWRNSFRQEGVTSVKVVRRAVELWSKVKWNEAVPWRTMLPTSSEEDESQSDDTLHKKTFVWNDVLRGEPVMVDWLFHSATVFSALLQSGNTSSAGMPLNKVQQWLSLQRQKQGSSDPNACLFGAFSPYSFLLAQYTLIYYLKGLLVLNGQDGNEQQMDNLRGQLETFKSQVLASMEILLDIPHHTYDFLDVFTNVSSYEIVVNAFFAEAEESMETAPLLQHFRTYDEYKDSYPVPTPYLPPWSADFVPEGFDTGGIAAEARARQLLVGAIVEKRRFGGSIHVAILHLHDATAWDDWSSLRTAWASLLPGGDAASAFGLTPHFYFTRVAGLSGCGEDSDIHRNLRAPFEALKELQREMVAERPSELLPPLDTAEKFLRRWAYDGVPKLSDAEILLCGEPVWLCPQLDRLVGRPMLMRFNMAVLDEFPLEHDSAVRAWWMEFSEFLSRGRAFASVGTRYTVEQVAYQTYGSVRMPYVPFLGLQTVPPGPQAAVRSAPRREVLLFHNNLPPLMAFKMVLKMVEARLPPGERPPPIVDMNDLSKGMCREEMGSFQAAVLLPHNPAPIRLVDLYAQGVIMYVPGEPLIHQWIWANRPFGGYRSPAVYTSMAPRDIFRGREEARDGLPPGHPPYSATAYLRVWSLTREFMDKRYWLQYTEWELMPGLRRFRGIVELLEMLRHDDLAEAKAERAAMNLHLQGRRAEALAWWRLTVLSCVGVALSPLGA
eukprot:TRINITY_DN10742_c0_g1_i1.p1 TRINITY_DN10742_c0_g1~~TRINITY_DN10742_c0_g1_i1.p1  ORF type:complete len:827 (-),score=109.00 TRINITY_DN10742_c0_g1_i1:102-2399(-)